MTPGAVPHGPGVRWVALITHSFVSPGKQFRFHFQSEGKPLGNFKQEKKESFDVNFIKFHLLWTELNPPQIHALKP